MTKTKSRHHKSENSYKVILIKIESTKSYFKFLFNFYSFKHYLNVCQT